MKRFARNLFAAALFICVGLVIFAIAAVAVAVAR